MKPALKYAVFISFCVPILLYINSGREIIKLLTEEASKQYVTITKVIENSSSEVTKVLDSSCIGMFDIGFGIDQASAIVNFSSIYGDVINPKDWHQLLKEKEAATQSYESYLPFANSVASRISKQLSNGSFVVSNKTRLQMMKGKLPYVPCTIKDYERNNLQRCLSKYQEKKKKLWVVFLGDSRARNMFLFFIKRTQEVIKWKIEKEKETNLTLEKIWTFRDHTSGINATSNYGDLVIFLPAVYGMTGKEGSTNSNWPKEFLFHLLKLNKNNERLPDLLVINFGIHEYVVMPHRSLYDRHDDLISNWKEMSKILKELSKKMNVLALYQTIPRDSSIQLLKMKKGQLWPPSHLYHEHILRDFGARFVDNVMRAVNRRSNVIQWDSTLPFYLLSSHECIDLVKTNHSSMLEEIDRFAPFQTFMCHDPIHKSFSTVHDESTQLLNLLCNKLLSLEHIYCCS